MDITVKDFMTHAWSSTDPVVLHNSDTQDQVGEYFCAKDARAGKYANYIVDTFSVDAFKGGSAAVMMLHLWVYKEVC